MTAPVIVIGSGSAGLFTALELRGRLPVCVITKALVADANTNWAQGGIAAAMDPADSPERHLADTIAAGAGLVDEEAARVLCYEGPAVITELIRHGVHFDRVGEQIAFAREAAHSSARVLHAGGDQTGAEIERALAEESTRAQVEMRTEAFATRLLLEAGRVAGVEVLEHGQRRSLEAAAVVIAAGGAGQLYAYTTNPSVATADGIALAFRAGAEVSDLEFFQFHPTALRLRGQRPFLISEAIRGEGAVLRNRAGEAFMSRYHPAAELAPRDIVARAIAAEMAATGADSVLLDCTAIRHVDVRRRFPGIAAFCDLAGLDIASRPIPVAPAAHYFMGGVRTDTRGRTTLPGLYACGEASATGVHGANRLASNSLLETVVFARRVADALAGGASVAAAPSPDAIAVTPGTGVLPRAVLQRLLWERAGIVRDGPGLQSAAAAIDGAAPGEDGDVRSLEDRNLTVVGRLLVDASLRREESRGAHYRSDFPDTDDRWKRRQAFVNASPVGD